MYALIFLINLPYPRAKINGKRKKPRSPRFPTNRRRAPDKPDRAGPSQSRPGV